MIRFVSRGEVRRYLPGVTRDAPEDRREERENDLIRAAIHLVRPSFVVRPVTYAAVRALADAVGVPPEWVWVPLPELPDVPLRVDDRVPLTVPCPDDPQDGRMHGCRVCEWSGWVSVAEATITEFLLVVEGDDLNGQHRIIRCRDTEGWLTAPKSGPATPLPGDWSAARFGVRLSDVKEVP